MGGMNAIEGVAGQMGQGSRPCVSLPLSLTCLLPFGPGLFSHYVGPDDNQSVSVSHYDHRCLLTTTLKLLL